MVVFECPFPPFFKIFEHYLDFLQWSCLFSGKKEGKMKVRGKHTKEIFHYEPRGVDGRWVAEWKSFATLGMKEKMNWTSWTGAERMGRLPLAVNDINLGNEAWCFFFQISHSVTSNSLWPHGPQHARPPCPSPTPRVYSNSCPLSRWCHPTISSPVVPFSSSLQYFPASGSFLS